MRGTRGCEATHDGIELVKLSPVLPAWVQSEVRSDAQAEAASEADRAFSRMGMHKVRNDAQGEFSWRSCPCIFPRGTENETSVSVFEGPRLNINPCVGSSH